MLKEFYLKEMFSGYTQKMPWWLKNEARKEIMIMRDMIKDHVPVFPDKKIRILDIGCGDCRVFKELILPYTYAGSRNYELIACDIFEYNELPMKFIRWLRDNNIEYKTIPRGAIDQYVGYYMLQKNWGKFDIITCLGVDVHLSSDQITVYTSSIEKMINKRGIAIWQTLRTDTLKAKFLKWKDRNLNYIARNSCMLKNCEVKQTGISNVFKYTKN